MPIDNKNNSDNRGVENNNELKHSDGNFTRKIGGSDYRIDSNDATIEQIQRLIGNNKGGNQNNNDNK